MENLGFMDTEEEGKKDGEETGGQPDQSTGATDGT